MFIFTFKFTFSNRTQIIQTTFHMYTSRTFDEIDSKKIFCFFFVRIDKTKPISIACTAHKILNSSLVLENWFESLVPKLKMNIIDQFQLLKCQTLSLNCKRSLFSRTTFKCLLLLMEKSDKWLYFMWANASSMVI